MFKNHEMFFLKFKHTCRAMRVFPANGPPPIITAIPCCVWDLLSLSIPICLWIAIWTGSRASIDIVSIEFDGTPKEFKFSKIPCVIRNILHVTCFTCFVLHLTCFTCNMLEILHVFQGTCYVFTCYVLYITCFICNMLHVFMVPITCYMFYMLHISHVTYCVLPGNSSPTPVSSTAVPVSDFQPVNDKVKFFIIK